MKSKDAERRLRTIGIKDTVGGECKGSDIMRPPREDTIECKYCGATNLRIWSSCIKCRHELEYTEQITTEQQKIISELKKKVEDLTEGVRDVSVVLKEGYKSTVQKIDMALQIDPANYNVIMDKILFQAMYGRDYKWILKSTLKTCDYGLSIYLDDDRLLIWKAKILQALEKYSEALIVIDQAILIREKLDPKTLDWKTRGLPEMVKSSSLFHLGKYEEAIAWATKASQAGRGRNVDDDTFVITCLLQLQRYDEAIAYIDKAIPLYRDSSYLSDLRRLKETITKQSVRRRI